jgi:hypothetical protein
MSTARHALRREKPQSVNGCTNGGTMSTVWTQEQRIEKALHLIKIHIEAEETAHNRDLHRAVQLIVTAARIAGILEA